MAYEVNYLHFRNKKQLREQLTTSMTLLFSRMLFTELTFLESNYHSAHEVTLSIHLVPSPPLDQNLCYSAEIVKYMVFMCSKIRMSGVVAHNLSPKAWEAEAEAILLK